MKILLILLAMLFSVQTMSQHRFKSVRDPYKYSEKNIDVKIFRAFNNIGGSFTNTLVNITNESLTPVTIAAPVGMYIAARINKNHYDESSAILLGLSELTSAAVTFGIKKTVQRDRPYRLLNNVNLTDTNSVSGTYSFPSGHSSGSFVISTLLTLRYPDKPWLIAGLYTWSTLVSLGRMYWGVHYPSDVLTGMLVGAGSAALIYSLRVPIIKAKNNLFNQSERTDDYKTEINPPALLITLAAADLINFYFSKSQNTLIKNSKVNFSTFSGESLISYSYGF